MKIKFMPMDIEVEATPEKTILQIATENKIVIKSLCKGAATCAECRVRIVSGEGFVTHPTKAELNVIGTSYYIDNRRLACQVRCFGPVIVDLSEQVNQEHLKNKKIRGFRSAKQTESSAVQDTLLLTEKPQPSQYSQASQGSQSSDESASSQANVLGGQGQNPNRNQNQNQKQNQNQGQSRGQRQGRNQSQSQNQGQNQNQNQDQNRGQNQNRRQGRNQPQNQGKPRGQQPKPNQGPKSTPPPTPTAAIKPSSK
ncbi:MAG: 2Fe-2S iron-sulfur cluster binding domain-containing protein [Bdellovibrionaceae bacterium]|nr:2Fe-2S iron-sulfur cluster binding domain-containing protein [Pseudobdellovibrionaceae bacterium]